MEVVSRVHARNLVAWAKDRPEVLVLSADLTGSCEADLFRDTYPDRFFSMGIAEQNMLSFAGGLAREGFTPYIHTFAVFIYRRAYDQVAMSVAYPNLRVRMIGFLPGITTPGGATHQAIEDIAVMRALPNMTVLEVGDATEVEGVLDVAQGVNGPVYIRMLRGELPRLFPPSSPMRLGAPRHLQGRAGERSDIVIVSSGICTEEAMRATQYLAAQGIDVQHFHVSTLKPFDGKEILEAISASRYGAVTLENHTVIGGLGSVLAEQMAEQGVGRKLSRLGLQDTFSHGASRPYLMAECGIDAAALVRRVGQVVGASFAFDPSSLPDVHVEAMHTQARPEAL